MSDYSKKSEFETLVKAVNKKINIEKKDPKKTIGDNNLVANKLIDIGRSILAKPGTVIVKEDLLNYYAVLRELAKQQYFGGYSDKLEADVLHTQPPESHTPKSDADLTLQVTQLVEHLFKAKKLPKDQTDNLKQKFRNLINQAPVVYNLSFILPSDPITSWPDSQEKTTYQQPKRKLRQPLQVQVVGKTKPPQHNSSAVNSVANLNSYQAGINNNNSNNQANHKRPADQTTSNNSVVKKYKGNGPK